MKKQGLVTLGKNTLVSEEQIRRGSEFYDRVVNANKDYFDYWLEETFLHWDFWLSFAFTVIPWIVFVVFRKKESTNRLLYAGLFAMILSFWLDFLGVVFGLWYYAGKVFPTIPSYAPWDFSILPVFIMLLIQYKPKVKAYWKGLIFAGVSAFIGEPFFTWLGFYIAKNWDTLYSFPIYFFIYIACHRLSTVEQFEPIK
jgi:hypothetical protein